MYDFYSVFSVPNYVNAMLFAAIAIICAVPAWRHIKHRDAPLTATLKGNTVATVVNVKQDTTFNMGMSAPKSYLSVKYKIDGTEYQNFVQVNPPTIKKYAALLKSKRKAEKAGKAGLPKRKDFEFPIYYDIDDPNTIACDDTTDQFRSNGRLFVCLFFAFAIAAVVFAIMPVE